MSTARARRFAKALVASSGLLVAVLLAATGTAGAAVLPPASVSATPSAVMPFVTSADSTVMQIVQCGSTMYAVGAFSQVGQPNGTRLGRTNAFSFNATTGAISSWNPQPNGTVESVAVSSDCSSVYLAGSFTTVNGVAANRLAKVSSSSAAVDTTFQSRANGDVETVVLTGGRLFVGGRFTSIGGATRTEIASLSPATGTADNYVTFAVSGSVPGNTGASHLYKMRLSHGGTRMLAVGNFMTAGGQSRQQMFLFTLGTTNATVDNWYAPAIAQGCDASVEPYFVRAAAWSVDDSAVYLATTGYKGASPLCDAVSKFSSGMSTVQQSLWINKTGCDSLYAVAADSGTVYVGGHERWLNNPSGCDFAGPGALSRPGVGAVYESTGGADAWNPTRSRGHGADDMIRTSAGLWVASDTYYNSTTCAGQYHPGICYFPNV